MLYYFLTIIVAIATLILNFVFIKKERHANKKNIFFKIISISIFLLFLIRYLMADIPLESVVGLENSPFDSNIQTVFAIVFNWLLFGSVLIVLLNSFFKIKNLRNLSILFVLPVSIVSAIFLRTNILAIYPLNNFQEFALSPALYALCLGLIIAYSILILQYSLDKKLDIDFKQIKTMIFSIIGTLVITTPAFLLMALFGPANPTISIIDLTIHHRIFIYLSFILPVAIYFILKNHKPDVIKAALIFISLAGLITFLSAFRFDIIYSPHSWPLHLCHTAMYIIPICLVFKLDKLFYFTYFINVFGAFIAILIPNYGARNMFDPRLVGFWVNHWWAFFMPLLIVALRVYGRPTLKTFLFSLSGFFIYFSSILFLNAWFLNYGNADFFFLNSDFIVSKLGLWAENTRDIIVSFKISDLSFVFYPLYQVLFFMGYVLIAFAMWFLYEQSYAFADTLSDMKTKKNKNKLEKDNFIMNRRRLFKGLVFDKENQNKIIFNNFGKRYGTSKELTVKNVNLEINAGEIFGFLGPNGSGKTTLIKSIVGLHAISEGSIQVCGYDVDKQSIQTKKIIGFVPDNYSLFEKLTGREYINYISDLYNVTKKDREERIKKYANLLNMTVAIDNKINTYSHGMKQKITIISSLVHKPKVWILDEPLTGLDPNSIYQIKECMRQHAREGNIVFFSSHIIDVVEKLCDRIAIIKSGQISDIKTLKEIVEKNKSLEEFYINIIGE